MQDAQWQKKIDHARWVEVQIMKWFQKNISPICSLPLTHNSGYDIICPTVGNIEVKEDLIADTSGNYAIEYEDFMGKPSGITKTTAEQFVIVDKKNVLMLATEALRYELNKMEHKNTVNMGYKTLNGRKAKGWLVPCEKLIHSPYARCLERWF
jgi:hypothetical protein